MGDDPDVPPPGGVGIGRGDEYVVVDEGGDAGGDAGRAGLMAGGAGRAAGMGGADGRGGGVDGRAIGVLAGGVIGRGGGVTGRAGEGTGLGAAGRGGAALGAAALGAAALRADFGAAFLAVFLAAFLAVFLAVFLRPAALRVERFAVLRVAALRAPARFLALDFFFFFELPPRAAFARFIAEVAAFFIFFRAVAAPERLFLLDFAMIVLR